MSDDQLNLGFDDSYHPAPALLPELRDEVAQIWGLPLGERVEVCFRGSQRAGVSGLLELHSSPAYPWNPREPLQLRIAGLLFSSREIERWTRL